MVKKPGFWPKTKFLEIWSPWPKKHANIPNGPDTALKHTRTPRETRQGPPGTTPEKSIFDHFWTEIVLSIGAIGRLTKKSIFQSLVRKRPIDPKIMQYVPIGIKTAPIYPQTARTSILNIFIFLVVSDFRVPFHDQNCQKPRFWPHPKSVEKKSNRKKKNFGHTVFGDLLIHLTGVRSDIFFEKKSGSQKDSSAHRGGLITGMFSEGKKNFL